MTNDDKIIEQYHSNPDKGFALLVKTYQQKVYWHIRRLVVSHEDAEDLLQDVFIKAYRKWDTFRGDSNIGTWLYRIATNECLTFLNKRKLKMATEDNDINYMNIQQSNSDCDDYSDTVLVALQNAIQLLPEMQRLVFNMRYYDNMSYDDIAQVTGSSTSAAKTNYHIAKGKIETYIKKMF